MSRRAIADPDEYLDELLIHVQAGTVVPIVGPELVTVEDEGERTPLSAYVARKLAEQCRIEVPPDGASISDVLVAYKLAGNYPEEIYTKIFTILSQTRFETPPALRKLAGIQHFDLFVSATFDSLLAQAIDEVRFEGKRRTREVVFSGTGNADLEQDWRGTGRPHVYYLLGQASAAPNYVVTDEDTLEFLYALSAPRTAENLFEILERSHLLVLGCGFPDWLSRFFIRLAKRKRLSEKRVSDLLADSRSHEDHNLALFLDNFSYRTRVFPGTATDFVDLLWDRWVETHGAGEAKEEEGPVEDGTGREVPADAIFISYAREDSEAAGRVWEGLRDITDVWMDRTLEPGENYAHLIKRRISECTLFIPVISRNTISRSRGFFHREWNQAVDRLSEVARGTPFIVPVIVDDTPEGADGVPEEFWDMHIARLPGGAVTPEFTRKVLADVRTVRAATRTFA